MTRNDRLAADAKGQRGIVTRQQAHAGGYSDASLRRRVQSGNLERIGVRTFVSPLMPRSSLDDLHALILDVGEPVWASDRTAAALEGYPGFDLRPPFHLLTLANRSVRRVGHVIHVTKRLELIDRETAFGVPVTSPTRTIIDLARSEKQVVLASMIEHALLLGLASEDFLHRRIMQLRSKGVYGVPKLIAALEQGELKRGGTSWLEREFLRILAVSRLPKPSTQVVLSKAGDKLVRVDFHYPSHRAVVEVLGYRWHRSKAQMNRDAERLNRLQLDGQRVIQFTYDDVVSHPATVVATVAELLDLSNGSLAVKK